MAAKIIIPAVFKILKRTISYSVLRLSWVQKKLPRENIAFHFPLRLQRLFLHLLHERPISLFNRTGQIMIHFYRHPIPEEVIDFMCL